MHEYVVEIRIHIVCHLEIVEYLEHVELEPSFKPTFTYPAAVFLIEIDLPTLDLLN
jgi:hypothetical protein